MSKSTEFTPRVNSNVHNGLWVIRTGQCSSSIVTNVPLLGPEGEGVAGRRCMCCKYLYIPLHSAVNLKLFQKIKSIGGREEGSSILPLLKQNTKMNVLVL